MKEKKEREREREREREGERERERERWGRQRDQRLEGLEIGMFEKIEGKTYKPR